MEVKIAETQKTLVEFKKEHAQTKLGDITVGSVSCLDCLMVSPLGHRWYERNAGTALRNFQAPSHQRNQL